MDTTKNNHHEQPVSAKSSAGDIKKVGVDIHGMTCQSCEVLIERNWKKIPGVVKVDVNHATGHAVLICTRVPYMNELRESVKAHGYQVTVRGDRATIRVPEHKNTKADYMEMGSVVLIIFALYMVLKEFNLIPDIGITDSMSYGIVFVIGLVAAMSTCIAVSGGLLLTLAAEYNKKFPNLSGFEKFKPHIYFNVGRIISYTVFGGLIGAVGSVFSLSPFSTGMITVAASVMMILLGFRLLNVFPALNRFQLRMPKFFAHKIHDASSGKHTKASAAILGAATFFLPCGFTQALQLYVLSKGDAATGALTMLVFSLGTLPALLSVGVISSFAKGAFQRYFLKFSGVLVVLIGFFTINNGLALAGHPIKLDGLLKKGVSAQKKQNTQGGAPLAIVDGKQVAEMKVVGYEYYPSRFTVRQGIPVEWRIDGSQAAGCAQVITAPKLRITEYLSKNGVKAISFTPTETGTFGFSCTMGMTTPGAAFTVISGEGASAGSDVSVVSANGANGSPEQYAGEVQKLSMEISNEKGFYPSEFTVTKGIPVELEINTKVPLSGCMGTMVIPDYDVAHRLTLGISTLRFTPTQEGTVTATCSMGSPLVDFIVKS